MVFQVIKKDGEIATIKGQNYDQALANTSLTSEDLMEGIEYVIKIDKNVDFEKSNKAVNFIKELLMCDNDIFDAEIKECMRQLVSERYHIGRSSSFAYKAHKMIKN